MKKTCVICTDERSLVTTNLFAVRIIARRWAWTALLVKCSIFLLCLAIKPLHFNASTSMTFWVFLHAFVLLYQSLTKSEKTKIFLNTHHCPTHLRHGMTYGGKRRSFVENENIVGLLAHRKHGTVMIKDFMYLLKYLRVQKRATLCKHIANFYHLTCWWALPKRLQSSLGFA